jgi:hypothetical protein
LSYALGSTVPLAITVRDAGGTPTAATVACTITLPDGTSQSPAPSTSGTGVYYVDYTPAQVGRHLVHWAISGTMTAAYNDVFEVDAAEIQPICSLADIKAHLNIPTNQTTNDAEMLNMALAISDLVESYLGYPIRRRTVTELYDGDTDALCLRTTPCPCSTCAQYSTLTVLTVTENTVPLNQGTDYVLDTRRGILRRGQFGGLYGYNWTWIYVYAEGISVTYTTGYRATPPWARQAFLRAMANSWQRTQNRPHPGIAQGAMNDEMPSQNPYALPYHVTAILQPHKGGLW